MGGHDGSYACYDGRFVINKQTNEVEIRIYQSLWKNILLGGLCLVFAVGGYFIIRDEGCNMVTKVLGGWLSVIFFGGGGLFVIILTLCNRIRRTPLLIIHGDRLEMYVQRKAAYYTVRFTDVERFRLIDVFSTKQIAIDYKAMPFINKFEESSALKQRVMHFNLNAVGAIESIPADNLTMKGKDICSLLNERLGTAHPASE